MLTVGTFAGDAGLSTYQAEHDMLAAGAEATAQQLGDVSHAVLLGTAILGTTTDQFLALDRWTSGTNIDAFSANPTLQAGFAKLFSPAPTITVYVAQPTWASYGTPDSANATDPHYWVVVRGTMSSTDLAKDQAAHDAIFANLAPQAKAAGDVAHVVFTGRDDVTDYFSIDVWPASTDLAMIYGNPALQSAFASLFVGTPTLGVYESTHWYQW